MYDIFVVFHFSPVQDVADSCRTGAATNVIFGLALGYKSVIIPIFAIAFSIFLSFSLAAMYGVAVAALGMLSTIATGLAIDAYGPISDNAGGIAEMAGMSHRIRERTDALDAAGNTTAAIGKVEFSLCFHFPFSYRVEILHVLWFKSLNTPGKCSVFYLDHFILPSVQLACPRKKISWFCIRRVLPLALQPWCLLHSSVPL